MEYSVLTEEEEKKLIAIKDCNKEARDALICHNLRLVTALAKEKYDKIKVAMPNISLDDLIQNGNIGLIVAVDKYQASKGAKLSTYAVYWIKYYINQEISKNSDIYIPEHKAHELSILSNSIDNFVKIFNREPSLLEIRLILNQKFDKAQIIDLLNLYKIKNGGLSMDVSVSDGQDDNDNTFGDLIPSREKTPLEYLEENEKKYKIDQALAKLNEKEQIVLNMSFGFNEDNNVFTLSQIAVVLMEKGYSNKNGKPFTDEGVRYIKNKALKKLKTIINRKEEI